VTWLTIGCDRPERRATGDNNLSLAIVTCTRSLTIGQESFSVSGLRYVCGMGSGKQAYKVKITLIESVRSEQQWHFHKKWTPSVGGARLTPFRRAKGGVFNLTGQHVCLQRAASRG